MDRFVAGSPFPAISSQGIRSLPEYVIGLEEQDVRKIRIEGLYLVEFELQVIGLTGDYSLDFI